MMMLMIKFEKSLNVVKFKRSNNYLTHSVEIWVVVNQFNAVFIIQSDTTPKTDIMTTDGEDFH